MNSNMSLPSVLANTVSPVVYQHVKWQTGAREALFKCQGAIWGCLGMLWGLRGGLQRPPGQGTPLWVALLQPGVPPASASP